MQHAPDCVTNVIVSNKVIQRWITGERFRYQPINFFFSPISQKYWPSLRAQHENVTRAIVFLVRARAFMLANDVTVILIDRTTRDEANLLVPTPDQAVKIKTGLAFNFERTFLLQLLEIRSGLCINVIAVDWGAFGQIDFRSRHMQETQRIAGREGACFLAVNYIVGNGGNFRGAFTGRTKCCKRANDRHRCLLDES